MLKKKKKKLIFRPMPRFAFKAIEGISQQCDVKRQCGLYSILDLDVGIFLC